MATIRKGASWLLLAFIIFAQSALAQDPKRFAREIDAFTAADATNPPPKHGILFIGSSSIRKWTTLAMNFPGRKVFNRGFGGSELSDSIYYFDRIVAPYEPDLIVLYAGSNDINGHKTPEQVFSDFKTFAAKVHAQLPHACLDFISIATSPSRWTQVEKVKEANRLIREYIAHDDKLGFIDVFPAMLGPDGKPMPDIYVADRLHMNPKGYAIWTGIVAPFLEKN